MKNAVKMESRMRTESGNLNLDEMEMGSNEVTEWLETLWNMSVIDIEGTLRKACHKLDKDSSVSKEHRVQRAKGLYELGMIFDAKGVEAEEGLKEIGNQLEQEMQFSKNKEEYLKKEQEQEKEQEKEKEQDLIDIDLEAKNDNQ